MKEKDNFESGIEYILHLNDPRLISEYPYANEQNDRLDIQRGREFLYLFMIWRSFGEGFLSVFTQIPNTKKDLCGILTELFGTTNSRYGVSK